MELAIWLMSVLRDKRICQVHPGTLMNVCISSDSAHDGCRSDDDYIICWASVPAIVMSMIALLRYGVLASTVSVFDNFRALSLPCFVWSTYCVVVFDIELLQIYFFFLSQGQIQNSRLSLAQNSIQFYHFKVLETGMNKRTLNIFTPNVKRRG